MVLATHEYKPDRVSPPGDSLLSILDERGITQAELARRMGRPTKTINEIVKGQRGITIDTALRLAAFFGTDSESWINLQTHYDTELAREAMAEVLSRIHRYSDQKAHS